MIKTTVKKSQFDAIRAYLESEQVELLVSDFNGVLDDYYMQKYTLLSKVLGQEHDSHLAALAVFTDTEYITSRDATLEQSIEKFFRHYDIEFNDGTRETLRRSSVSASLTEEAEDFLNELTIPYVIYTSQNAATMKKSLNGLKADVYSRDRTGKEKPSVQNLEMIMRDYNVQAEHICVLGDGLIDDLMPARLMGMKTILISPFANTLYSIG